jgi:dienelactone hydrolase
MKGLVAAALIAALPLSTAAGEEAETAERHYYPRAAQAEGAAHPWVVILPGGGGMDVFGDEQFYFDVAREWNAAGFDALVVHYQAAAPLLEGVPQGPPGPMEAAVVADALGAAGRNGWLDLQCPGFAVGFSMGGAGALTLAANPPANLAGAIGFYPMVLGQQEGYRAAVPVLVLQGDDDELTTRPALDAFLAKTDQRERFTVHYYSGAQHGFDIPSLATPVEFNGGTFEYHPQAGPQAHAEAAAFRRRVLVTADAPAECRIAQEN